VLKAPSAIKLKMNNCHHPPKFSVNHLKIAQNRRSRAKNVTHTYASSSVKQ